MTSGQAAQTSAQARFAAAAYEGAFASTVPPAVIDPPSALLTLPPLARSTPKPLPVVASIVPELVTVPLAPSANWIPPPPGPGPLMRHPPQLFPPVEAGSWHVD